MAVRSGSSRRLELAVEKKASCCIMLCVRRYWIRLDRCPSATRRRWRTALGVSATRVRATRICFFVSPERRWPCLPPSLFSTWGIERFATGSAW